MLREKDFFDCVVDEDFIITSYIGTLVRVNIGSPSLPDEMNTYEVLRKLVLKRYWELKSYRLQQPVLMYNAEWLATSYGATDASAYVLAMGCLVRKYKKFEQLLQHVDVCKEDTASFFSNAFDIPYDEVIAALDESSPLHKAGILMNVPSKKGILNYIGVGWPQPWIERMFDPRDLL